MSDEQSEKLSHEDVDRWCREQPTEILDRLPNNIESREAKRLTEIAADLAHRSLEKAPRE